MVEFVSSCDAKWRRPVEMVDGVACIRLFDGTPCALKKMKHGYFVRFENFVFCGTLRVKAKGRLIESGKHGGSVFFSTRDPAEIARLETRESLGLAFWRKGKPYHIIHLSVTRSPIGRIVSASAVLIPPDWFWR